MSVSLSINKTIETNSGPAIWSDDWSKFTIHGILSIAIMTVYGVQVCPFIETISYPNLVLTFLVGFLAAGILRFSLRTPINKRLTPANQARLLFPLDLGCFMLVGVIVATYNLVFYDAPWDSLMKVFIGLSALGFYAASDLALYREKQFREFLVQSDQSVDLSDNFIPYHKKFIAFSIVNILVVSTVILLLIFKDLQWMGASNVPVTTVQWAVFAEILFVFVVCSAYVTRIVLQYARTMSNSLNSQNSVLRQVQGGRTDTSVPIVSNDEFGHMAYFTNQMISAAAKRRSELFSAQEATVLSLTSLAGVRDNETGMHILRTQHYVRVLARSLRNLPEYAEKLTDDRIDMYFRAAPLHDIGKVGIPDAILKKPGKLTDDEFKIMKTHTILGVKALEEAKKQIGDSEFLTAAHEIALTHHERWDGQGYPYGLRGASIPLSGRLMAVADVYDALRSARVYKQGQSHDSALRTIAKGRGSQFDPDIIEALYACEQEIQEISEKFADKELHLASRPLLVYSA